MAPVQDPRNALLAVAALAVMVALLVPVLGCTSSEGPSAGQAATTTPVPQSPATAQITPTTEAMTAPSPAAPDPSTGGTVTVSGPASTKLGPGLHDFTLPDAHGGQVTLSQYLGEKTVVLTFYRAWW